MENKWLRRYIRLSEDMGITNLLRVGDKHYIWYEEALKEYEKEKTQRIEKDDNAHNEEAMRETREEVERKVDLKNESLA